MLMIPYPTIKSLQGFSSFYNTSLTNSLLSSAETQNVLRFGNSSLSRRSLLTLGAYLTGFLSILPSALAQNKQWEINPDAQDWAEKNKIHKQLRRPYIKDELLVRFTKGTGSDQQHSFLGRHKAKNHKRLGKRSQVYKIVFSTDNRELDINKLKDRPIILEENKRFLAIQKESIVEQVEINHARFIQIS